MFRPTLRTIRPVYTPCPVNWRHSLNRGRVAWWLCLPQRMAGFTWYDIAGRNHGALTSMGNSSNGWRGVGPPGTQGGILFDGSAGYITNSTLNLGSPSELTASVWIKALGWNPTNRTFPIAKWTDPSEDSFAFSVGYGNTGRCSIITSSSGAYNSTYDTVSTLTLSLLVWYRVVFAWTPNVNTIYVNGSVFASGTGSPSLFNNSATPIQIGTYPAATTFFNGFLDDVSIWNRSLSPSEILADYQLSQRGYPGVLNRWWTPEYGSYSSAYTANFSENEGIVDAMGRVVSYTRSQSDNEGITDTLTRVCAFARSQLDNEGETDSMFRVGSFARSVVDNEGITDLLSRIQTLSRSFADPVGETDVMAWASVFRRIQTDNEGITDTASRVVQYIRSQTDIEGETDAINRVLAFIRTQLDNEGITDHLMTQLAGNILAITYLLTIQPLLLDLVRHSSIIKDTVWADGLLSDEVKTND
jgi:concanavalin A-like lectin/glucanase superfamily protein